MDGRVARSGSVDVHLKLCPEVPVLEAVDEGGEKELEDDRLPDEVVEDYITEEVGDDVPDHGGDEEEEDEGEVLLHNVPCKSPTIRGIMRVKEKLLPCSGFNFHKLRSSFQHPLANRLSQYS